MQIRKRPGVSAEAALSGRLLPAVRAATPGPVELAVIWLHGLGADGHDFEPIVPALGLDFGVRFVFPHAPLRPVSVNGGMTMRAWYDIVSLDREGPEDADGIRASAAAVTDLIDAEVDTGLDASRVVVAGFSQGGAIALYAALRERRRLAGVLALSSYLPLAPTLAAERAPENAELPILVAHGRDDQVIPLALAERSRAYLESLGYRVDFSLWPVAHGVSMDEIAAVGRWLSRLR